MLYQYPLDLRFKLVALAPRIIVTDANGKNVCFVSQKTFKLKEDIQVFSDESRSTELYRIKADRVIDFSATYQFSDSATGKSLGAIRSKGWRSLWKATYEIVDAQDQLTHRIEEDNPWIKVADALMGEIPYVGLFTGYFLHPSYSANDVQAAKADMQLKKEPSFFEGRYSLDQLGEMSAEEETRLMLSFLLMVQFMRRRG
ncbi:MAG: hypothetical protein ABI700_24025 [Chloroflexota bacterium]